MNTFRLTSLSLAMAAAMALPAHAQSLLELYELARSNDAAYQSAKAQAQANDAKGAQALGGMLPSVNLSASAYTGNVVTADPSGVPDRNFDTQNASLNATQPLYRSANYASYQQGNRQSEIAQAQLEAAEQDLIVRVSQAYFDALAAQDSLTFVQAQKVAVAEQLAAAKRNFEVGASTVTDSREAQARFDLVSAQEIAADNDLRVKRLALDQLVGTTGVSPLPLATPTLPALQPDDVNSWVQQAMDNHPVIKQARLALEIAEYETQKAEAGHKPTLDLVGSLSLNNNHNGSAVSNVTSRTTTTMVGVVFNMPLFAGFSTSNRVRETVSLEEKARADLDAAQRNIALATRSAYFGVQAGKSQVLALEAAEASSQSALDANKLGYKVGVRINIDVLNSQSQLYQTKRDLAKARYDVLVGGLRLRQASGSLKADDLQAVNALLAPAAAASTEPAAQAPATDSAPASGSAPAAAGTQTQ